MKDLLKIAIDQRPDNVHVEARYHQRKTIEARPIRQPISEPCAR